MWDLKFPNQGLKPPAPAVEAWSLNHWATKGVPTWLFIEKFANPWTALFMYLYVSFQQDIKLIKTRICCTSLSIKKIALNTISSM